MINSRLFIKWLDQFDNSVPTIVNIPLVLVCDGYLLHYNGNVVEKSIDIYIILVLFQDNDNHLIQNLNVTVFNPFRTILKQTMDNFVIDKSYTECLGMNALAIPPETWGEVILTKKKNIVSVFLSSGIWPTSFPETQSQWCLLNDGEINSNLREVQPWLTCRDIV